jgi:hypothetical protein
MVKRQCSQKLKNVYMSAFFESFGNKSLSSGGKLALDIYGNPNSF